MFANASPDVPAYEDPRIRANNVCIYCGLPYGRRADKHRVVSEMRLCWLRRHLISQNRDCNHDVVRSLHLVFVADQPNALLPAVGSFDDLGDGGSSPFHAVGDPPGPTNRY